MTDFDTRQLRYFVTAADLGSMSQAARRLFVSQQALSKGITALEATLGAPLLVREKSGVTPTEFGALALDRARETLAAADRLGACLDDFRAHEPRVIRVGMPPKCTADFGGTLSIPRMYALQKAFSNVEFTFAEMSRAEVLAGLEGGSLEFGIGDALDPAAYESRLLATFPLVAIVSKLNPLSGRGRVTPADLAGGTVALTSDDIGHLIGQLERQSGLRIPVAPIMVEPVDEADLVVTPDTFAISPEQHARRTTLATDRVTLLPLVDGAGSPVCVDLCLSWRKAMPLGAPEQLLIRYLCELYARRGQDDAPQATGR